MFTRKLEYETLPSQEVDRSLPDGDCFFRDENAAVTAIRERRFRLLSYANCVLFALSLCALFRALTSQPSELECAKIVSPYSPMWEAVEFWEGDLTNYFNHSSIYRGPPTLEREMAWNDLWHYPGIGVDEAGIKALNKTNHGRHVEIVGSDPDHPTYDAIVEVFHQLHCLNLIRQATWPIHMFDKSWGDILYPWDLEEPVGGRIHVDHCIEALRLSLMCYSDITPVLLEYDENRQAGHVIDFSAHHKCRNFDKVVDYVKENGVGIPFDMEQHTH